jgi:signal transduction histidine kinase/CheY-like chemotaxis protein
MERAITWITSLVALAILVLLPGGYFGLQQAALQAEMRLEAEASAQLITQLINANPELWRFQIERVDQILARRPGDGTPEIRSLHDAQERVLAASSQSLANPTLTVVAPVFDSGREVGRVEVVRSLQPALLGSALAALLAAILAGAVFATLRLLPLRALRRAEQKAREQAEQAALLEKARQDAVAEARLKTHVLARLTHEIRAPLGGLLGMTESLRGAPMTASQRLQAQRAHESGAALLQVVNDILDYSNLQGTDLVVAYEQFDPIPLVEGVIEAMTPQAEAAGLTLYYEVGPGLPAQMEGDSGRLRQVLNNLVSNAVKFTPRGDVKINVKWTPPTASAVASIYFEVRDSGVGLSPEDQARLFDPVPQAAAGMARAQPGGGGMGLAICRQLVHSMSGRMGVQSQLGQGARFWFELPQRQAQIALSQAWPTDAAGAPLHALVADPHIGRARAMCSRLMALGLRVNAVHTADALRTVLAKPGLRFTHVLALASLGVKAREARWVRWITLRSANSQAIELGDDVGAVLNLPFRRDELVQLLTEGTAARSHLIERSERAVESVAAAVGETGKAPPIIAETAGTIDTSAAPASRVLPSTPPAPAVPPAPEVRPAPAAGPVDLPGATYAPTAEVPEDEIDTVTDPVLQPEPMPAPTSELAPAPPHPASSLPEGPAVPTVLLVESNQVSQEMGRALLESMGCEVHVADDGHEALQRLPQGFGLILLDLQVQGMDGYTTASEIRRWEALQTAPRRTPLVALTADEGAEVRQRCVASGMDDIVGKPVDRLLLRETLERYLPALVAA